MKHTKRTLDEWRQLTDRYFEAETTDAEEAELRLFAVSDAAGKEFDELRAVMGYIAAGRALQKRPTAILRLKKVRHIAAAAVVAAALLTGWHAIDANRNECAVYIGGARYTDEAIVIEQLHYSMRGMAEASNATDVESQLSDLFGTLKD